MKFLRNSKIDTDLAKIEEFLDRGVENVYPNKDFVRSKLLSGQKLTFYLGIDPTAPSIHVGHSAPLFKIKTLQEMGHQVIILIGDFTATIGDPDKLSVRKPLTRQEVLQNCKKYKEQIGHIVSFSGPNKAKFVFNSKWLSKMTFADVLNLASKMTVEQMLKRDMFVRRQNEGRPIYIHEFMYPLMQGYDSVVMKVDGEIGGNDQTFNMLAGRTLQKQILNAEKIVITTKLLADASGKKMGKTEGNAVMLDQSPEEMFGVIMSWDDSLIIPAFELLTSVGLSEISNKKERLEKGENPKNIKIELAKEIITTYHNKKLADEAESRFSNTFAKGGVPENVLEVKVIPGEALSSVLVENNIVSSKSEFRRLILEGAIHNLITKENILDHNYKISQTVTVRVGKKRFVKLVV